MSEKSASPPPWMHANYRRDVERFDRWAPGYDRSWTQRVFFGPVHRGVMRVAANVAPAPMRILDVGCGTGALLRTLSGRFPKAYLTGLDASAEMIRMAGASNPSPKRMRFIHGTAEDLPFTDEQFDLIVSTISFHHWADQRRGLHEVARALAPGAPFVLADHFVTLLQRVFFSTSERRKRIHTPKEIDGMLASAGLEEPRWHDIYRVGPLLLITGVTANKPPPDHPDLREPACRVSRQNTESAQPVHVR